MIRDRTPNYSIFEKDSEYWNYITNYGKLPVPTFVVSRVIFPSGDIEERKHPVIILREEKSWMTNYSDTL